MKRIPISYIVKAQNLYVRVFEIEDSCYITVEESRERGQKQRAIDDYVEKMFLNDEDTIHYFYKWLYNSILSFGTFEEICNCLRNRGYMIISKDNATKTEMKECEKECLEQWKEWKKHEYK